jgi:hypothetical protein
LSIFFTSILGFFLLLLRLDYTSLLTLDLLLSEEEELLLESLDLLELYKNKIKPARGVRIMFSNHSFN